MPTTSIKSKTSSKEGKSDQELLFDNKFTEFFEAKAALAKVFLKANPVPPELLKRKSPK